LTMAAMSGPRIFVGKESHPVTTPAVRSRGPVTPVENGDGTIFVSIPSYRDGERCGETLKALFENAKNPDKIFVGLVEQNNAEDKFCMEQYCSSYGVQTIKRNKIREDMFKVVAEKRRGDCPRFDQIGYVAYHNINAKGPMLARSLARKVLGNEEFCMQIDAHTDFAKDWDEILRDQWKRTKNEFGILSTVPPPKSAKADYSPGGSEENDVPRQCMVKFRDNGFPDYESPADGRALELTEPLLSLGWSAAFSFAKCHLEETTPYDPFSYYAMPVEQFSRYARFWTRG
jgi:hypothetical protein